MVTLNPPEAMALKGHLEKVIVASFTALLPKLKLSRDASRIPLVETIFNVDAVGVILMIVGAVGVLLFLTVFGSWGTARRDERDRESEEREQDRHGEGQAERRGQWRGHGFAGCCQSN